MEIIHNFVMVFKSLNLIFIKYFSLELFSTHNIFLIPQVFKILVGKLLKTFFKKFVLPDIRNEIFMKIYFYCSFHCPIRS